MGELGFDLSTAISLNKKNRWETIPEAMEKTAAAKGIWERWGKECEVYGVTDDWSVDDLVSLMKYQEKMDHTYKPTFVKDRHYYAMQKQKRFRKKDALAGWPKNLLKYERLKGSTNSPNGNAGLI